MGIAPSFRDSLKPLRRLGHARGGNVAVIAAICFPVFVVVAAFAVDEGAIFNERRTLQGLADLAAITAAAHPEHGGDAALMALLDNGLPATLDAAGQDTTGIVAGRMGAQVTGGRYDGTADLAPERRFMPGVKPFNAFKVELRRTGSRYFSQGLIEPPVMRVSAIGHAAPEAAVRIGSRLARLDGGVANALLGALVGGEIGLSVMDYRGLLDARVDMLDVFDGLAAALHLKAATYSDLFDASVSLPDLLDAMSRTPSQNAAAASTLRNLARAADRRLSVPLRSLFDPGMAGTWPVGIRQGPLSASANVLEAVDAAAGIARGGRQVEASLGADAAGVLGGTLSLVIGEREQGSPWMRLGERGATVRTAQTRFLLRLRLDGPGGALGSLLNLPLYGDIAFAQAKLTDIACLPGKVAPARVTVSAQPGVATLGIGDTEAASMADFRREPTLKPALLTDAKLVKVFGASRVTVANAAADTLNFSAKEIEAGTTKTIATRDLLSSPTASLVDNLVLDVQAGPLALGPPSILGGTLSRTLREAAEPVDAILFSVLATLGVSVGEADVTVSGGVCNRAVLVQ